ncbi:MAG: type II toxin-antitoxin system RelE/ParE family toxin [Rhizobiales bacterium]|nr:type II toxin-antitoxin system RelE/ParE family toxin [Hyphomicrobiales bacterium]
MLRGARSLKPCDFVGPARKELSVMPDAVRVKVGHSLFLAQRGEEAQDAKPLKGFGGRGVLEIIADHDGSTYRAVYTVRFAGAIYVLHAFQKKSKTGIATPKHTMDLIAARLKDAEIIHRHRISRGEKS